MINDKQMELSQRIFDTLKIHFPEIELVDIIESWEDPTSIWIRIAMPEDDDREIALLEMAAEMAADILEDYGYHILAFLTSKAHLEKKKV